MSTSQTVIFMTIVLGMSLGMHAYVATRLMAPWDLPLWGRALGYGLAGTSALSIPVLFQLMRFTGQAWADRLQVLGWGAFGIFSLLIVFTMVRDLGWGAAALASWATGPDRLLPADPGRRAFLGQALNAGVLALAGGIGAAGFLQVLRGAKVERVRVAIAGLPEALRGLRIAQISDLHVGPTIRAAEMRAVVEKVNALDADIVAVTGDLVDGSVGLLAGDVAPLGELKARHGVFFITGNHEYYSGAEAWCAHCAESLGWRVLLNEHAVLEHEGARVLVAGVTDATAGRYLAHHAQDLDASLAGAPATDLRVLLAHQPAIAPRAAERGFHLQLSGHTHGGQYFPFTVLIHLAQRFVQGLHRLDALWVYVNRGTMYWGPPIRLGAAQEITLLELVPA